MDDEKRKIYPRISIAAIVYEYNTLEDVLYTLVYEITHYYQWYFLEENNKADKSLKIENNRCAKYILDSYFL